MDYFQELDSINQNFCERMVISVEHDGPLPVANVRAHCDVPQQFNPDQWTNDVAAIITVMADTCQKMTKHSDKNIRVAGYELLEQIHKLRKKQFNLLGQYLISSRPDLLAGNEGK